MSTEFFGVDGDEVDAAELTVAKARLLADALLRGAIEFASFVEARRGSGADIVVIDVEVELPQVRTNPIESRERLAVYFSEADEFAPEVLALRRDFPRVPHLNLRHAEFPRSLCLNYESYRDLKRSWTAPRFVARIREWLKLTAKGTLHQDDQPLEPLLIESDGILLLPSKSSREKCVQILRDNDSRAVEAGDVFCAFFRCTPRVHGVIYHRPRTLLELAEIVAPDDLLDVLRRKLLDWHERDTSFLQANMVIVLEFPLQRQSGHGAEELHTWAFQTRHVTDEGDNLPAPIRVVGEALGVWQRVADTVGLLIPPDTAKRGRETLLDVLNPISGATARALARWNGREQDEPSVLCAVGVGALGSQVVLNVARAGYGHWILIDEDRLMPHNIARHALGTEFVGEFKSLALAHVANALADDGKRFAGSRANVLSPGVRSDEVSEALSNAKAIIDMSASVTVARHLALAQAPGRRVSLFLSPTALDLVLLAEDAKRTIGLDVLEMQYYRACATADLAGHLSSASAQGRYGASCRDLSRHLPQHLIAQHAGIGARFLPTVLSGDDARISVWRTRDDGSVSHIQITPFRSIRAQFGDWRVVTDEGALHKLYDARRNKLPKETGGVLLGSIDLDRRIIYVVDTVLSPPDSEEWPTMYIRGCRGLLDEVKRIDDATLGNLEYVGEWHSHPAGFSTNPSRADMQVFAWIADHMDREGLPAVMMIVGDDGNTSCFVGQMTHEESLLPPHELQ